MKGNDEFRKQLCDRILGLLNTICAGLSGAPQENISQDLQQSIEKLNRYICSSVINTTIDFDLLLYRELLKIQGRCRLTGFMPHTQVAELLKECSSMLDWAIEAFQVC